MKKLLLIIFIISIYGSAYSAVNPIWAWLKNSQNDIKDFTYCNNYLYSIGNVLQKWDTNGNLIWTKAISGNKIAIDNSNNLVILTSMSSASQQFGSTTLNSNGGTDVVLIKTDSAGNYLWVQNYGDVGNDNASEMCIDVYNSIYLIGLINNISGILKVNANNNIVWHKQINTYITHIANSNYDSTIVIYGAFIGNFQIDNFSIASVSSPMYGQTYDMYIAKLKLDSNALFLKNVTNTYRGDFNPTSFYINQSTGKIYYNYSTWNSSAVSRPVVKFMYPNGTNAGFNIYNIIGPIGGLVNYVSGDNLTKVSILTTDNGLVILNDTTGAMLNSYNIEEKNKTVFGNNSLYFNLPASNNISEKIAKLGDSSSSLFVMNFDSLINVCNYNLNYVSNFVINNDSLQPLTYLWTPTSGVSNDSLLNPTFNIDSTITYKLTIKDANNTILFQDSFHFAIHLPPTINATISNNSICAGDTYMLNCTGANTYIWDNNPFYKNNTLYFANNPITHQFSVIATDTNGCSASDTVTIVVNQKYNQTEFINLCSGENYIFPDSFFLNNIVSNTTHIIYLITINGCDSIITTNINIINSTSSTSNYSICSNQIPYIWNTQSFSASGTYTASFTNSLGCDSLATLNLVVNSNSTSTTNLSICNNQTPYIWNTQSLSASGTYTASFTNITGCDSISTLNLVVNNASASVANLTICSNQTPYIWNTQSLTASGTYTASFTNSLGCDSIATLILVVNPNPPIGLIPDADTTICPGTNYILHAKYTSPQYSWAVNGTTISSADSLNILYKASYRLIVTDTNGCKSKDSVYINIMPNLFPIIIQNNAILTCTNVSNVNFIWRKNGIVIGTNSDTVAIMQNGIYIVKVLDSNLCMAFDTLIINNVALNNLSVKGSQLIIYPNPAKSILYVEGQHAVGDKIEIFNALGQKVIMLNCINENKEAINIAALSTGLYTIKVNNTVQKFRKE